MSNAYNAYFDCFMGVSGDMVLGALVDAGMPLAYLKKELGRLGLKGYWIELKKQGRMDIAGTNLHVRVIKEAGFSHYADIKKLISSSRLHLRARQRAISIFDCLAGAEARVHRKNVRDIHFHEIGGVDSIVDIVGSVIGLDYFGFKNIYSSPLPVTRGFVKCAHGVLPIPAPAALEILKGVPVTPSPLMDEIVTPTGAAILKTISDGFGSLPLRVIRKTGYGFGDKRYAGCQNALRLLIGEGQPLFAVEVNIDDMNPEFYPYVIGRLLEGGAVDAGVMPLVMKNGRPGALIRFLCEERDRKKLIKILMEETTTFGARYYPVERETAEREFCTVKTKWGAVRVKIARSNGRVTSVSPEFADCEKLARSKRVAVKSVYAEAVRLAGTTRR